MSFTIELTEEGTFIVTIEESVADRFIIFEGDTLAEAGEWLADHGEEAYAEYVGARNG